MNAYLDQAKVIGRYAATAAGTLVAMFATLHILSGGDAATVNSAIVNITAALNQISDGLVKLLAAVSALVPVYTTIRGVLRSTQSAKIADVKAMPNVDVTPLNAVGAAQIAAAVAPATAGPAAKAAPVILAMFLAGSMLVGCSGLQALRDDVQTAFDVATSAAVTPTEAYIAINAYDGVEATATNYLGWPRCTGSNGPLCRDPAVRMQIKKIILAGRVARNDVKAYLRANPGKALAIQSFDDMQAATSALRDIITAYKIN